MGGQLGGHRVVIVGNRELGVRVFEVASIDSILIMGKKKPAWKDPGRRIV